MQTQRGAARQLDLESDDERWSIEVARERRQTEDAKNSNEARKTERAKAVQSAAGHEQLDTQLQPREKVKEG